MSQESQTTRNYSVLYVDDEEQALKYFRKGLEKAFTVLTASSVQQALEILEKDAASIGILITDQRMPGKSGVSLLTEARHRWPAIVRILITAYTEIDSAVAAVNAGAIYKYINKPADFPMLRQTLADAMNVHRETLHRDAMAQTLRELEAQREATKIAEARREQLQQRLIAASREAGRAEIATGILHNVGNVLNSMNVSAAVVTNTLQDSRVGNLCKGLAMLEEHSSDLVNFITADERGQRLPGYLAKLAPVLAREQTVISDAMTALNRNIEHIVQVVQSQQAHAKGAQVRQEVDAADLMDEAVRVNQTLIADRGVSLQRAYGSSPRLFLDPHSVLQILINLVSNAAHAVSGNSPELRKMTLLIADASASGNRRVKFQVIDSGAGIAPENITRIFTHGFTTRADGHGFGLHSAANAAREMGGSLAAASDGPGTGATFTLELPINQDEAATAPTPSKTGETVS